MPPIRKFASSPIPLVAVENNPNRFFTSSIRILAIGQKANTNATADNTATGVIVRIDNCVFIPCPFLEKETEPDRPVSSAVKLCNVV